MLDKSLWCCKNWGLPFLLCFSAFISVVIARQISEVENEQNPDKPTTISRCLTSRPLPFHTTSFSRSQAKVLSDVNPSTPRSTPVSPTTGRSTVVGGMSVTPQQMMRNNEVGFQFRGRILSGKRVGREVDMVDDSISGFDHPTDSRKRHKAIYSRMDKQFDKNGSMKSSNSLWGQLMSSVDLTL